MKYRADTIYHVFNQGNNKQRVFFSHANYIFFTAKVVRFLLPYADILAYCLMPNHFHFLIRVNSSGLEQFQPLSNSPINMQRFNSQLAILLRSYTSAINKQENRSGSIFRQHTKSKIVKSSQQFLDPESNAVIDIPEYANYFETCLHYIHNNPVRTGLVNKPSEWKYSSCSSFLHAHKNTFCKISLAKQLCTVT